nr:MAG TPA: hypothetical protein [Caudoviricetes sp.]
MIILIKGAFRGPFYIAFEAGLKPVSRAFLN